MTVGIIGFGNFGKAIALLLSSKVDIVAYDSDPENIPSYISMNTLEKVCQCEVVVLAVPLGSYDSIFCDLEKLLPRTSVLVDVCSVKTIAEQFKQRYLSEHFSYLSIHPLFGPRSILESQTEKTIVSTHCGNEHARKVLHEAAATIGDVNIIETTAEMHDKTMAHTQALTFFLGQSLQDFLPKETIFAPPSYALLTELRDFVANSSPHLTATIESNPYFDETIESFIALLSKSKDATT